MRGGDCARPCSTNAEGVAMNDIFAFADDLGPIKILHIYEPGLHLKAVVAVDNVAIGPAIGGIRMSEDATAEEAFRLARAMTLKNAAAGLSHGGAKSVVLADPMIPSGKKERLIRAFARAIEHLHEYIPGPDMGTDETCMAWVRDEIGRAVGLPRELGGIPLDQIGATGWGLLHAIQSALPFLDLPMEGLRVAVQGFGAVGSNAARFLAERGALIVGVADIQGSLYNPHGLDVANLIALKKANQPLHRYPDAEKLGREEVIRLECDVLIPAARPDVVTLANVERLNTRLVAQGANIPCTAEAEQRLHDRGILVLPDFIANAGGVICAAVESQGGDEDQAMREIAEKVGSNTRRVLEEARRNGCPPRTVALAMARERLMRAMRYGRIHGENDPYIGTK